MGTAEEGPPSVGVGQALEGKGEKCNDTLVERAGVQPRARSPRTDADKSRSEEPTNDKYSIDT